MTSFTTNLTAANTIARHTISERVAAAQARALVREAKGARRAAKRVARHHARPTSPSQHQPLPLWATRFMFPAR